jgi:diketogulonate reductase-like aldo/keto reductase
MKTRNFGPTGHVIPHIGQGTWHLDEADPKSAVAALERGLELGLTHIDTAELYGSGRAEALVARAIARRRDDVYLVSKVMPSNASFEGTLKACERSLRHLGTERIDCYLLHWRGPYALEATFEAFERLREQGKIRDWGVSNFDEDDLAEALVIAGPNRIACNQVLYNLEERSIEHGVLPFCEENGIAVVGYTPFGTSRFPPSGAGGKVLADIAAQHAATPRQVALAFLTRRPALFTIPKSSRIAHTEENAGALALDLSSEDLSALDAAFPVGPRRRGVAML